MTSMKTTMLDDEEPEYRQPGLRRPPRLNPFSPGRVLSLDDGFGMWPGLAWPDNLCAQYIAMAAGFRK